MYCGTGTVRPEASMDETIRVTSVRWNRSSRPIPSNTSDSPRAKALRALPFRARSVFNATPFIIECRPMGITFHPAPPLYATTCPLHASQKKTLHFDPRSEEHTSELQ